MVKIFFRPHTPEQRFPEKAVTSLFHGAPPPGKPCVHVRPGTIRFSASALLTGQLLHQLPEPAHVFWRYRQMDIVGHQAPRVDFYGVDVLEVSQRIEVAFQGSGFSEDHLPMYAHAG
jgi:hypothetical protein